MLSLVQLVCISGLVFVSCVSFTEQGAVASGLSSDEEFQLDKRRIDGHSRTSIPIFRGSNLGIFVRKRPSAAFAERSVFRRKDTPASSDNILAGLFNAHEQQQRRSDDYADNPGPMFGR